MNSDTYRDELAQSLQVVNDDEHAKYTIWSHWYELAEIFGGEQLEYFAWLDRFGLK